MTILSGKALLAGVIGHPVGHSLSPRLHGFWLNEHQIDGVYMPLAVTPDNFPEALRALPKMGFAGVNITVPHKVVALQTVDIIEPSAKKIGAVNTVIVGNEGRLIGANTDGYGFIENLKSGMNNSKIIGPVVVLGAGGAARAVIVSLLEEGVSEIRLLNRTRGRAEQLAQDISGHFNASIQVIDWEIRAQSLEGAGLLVNTTTLGMVGKPQLDIDLSALPKSAWVTDIVYAPLQTPLLKAAMQRGNPVVDGIGMLLHQARPGFERWFGKPVQVTTELRNFVLAGMG